MSRAAKPGVEILRSKILLCTLYTTDGYCYENLQKNSCKLERWNNNHLFFCLQRKGKTMRKETDMDGGMIDEGNLQSENAEENHLR